MARVNLTVHIEAEAHNQLKLQSVKQQKRMWQLVQEIVEEYLSQCKSNSK